MESENGDGKRLAKIQAYSVREGLHAGLNDVGVVSLGLEDLSDLNGASNVLRLSSGDDVNGAVESELPWHTRRAEVLVYRTRMHVEGKEVDSVRLRGP